MKHFPLLSLSLQIGKCVCARHVRKTTEIYSNRLRSRRPLAANNSACLTLNLFETSVLGWAPPESYSDWRGPPGHFELILKDLGFRGVYLKATEGEAGTDPCTIFDPHRQMGMQLVANISDLPSWDAGCTMSNPAESRRGQPRMVPGARCNAIADG